MRKTTSLMIDPEVWKEGKKMAIDKGMGFGEFMESLIKEKLEKE